MNAHVICYLEAQLNGAYRYFKRLSLKPEYGGIDMPAHTAKVTRDLVYSNIKYLERRLENE